MLQNAKIEKKITFPDKFADAETLTNDKVKKKTKLFLKKKHFCMQRMLQTEADINKRKGL